VHRAKQQLLRVRVLLQVTAKFKASLACMDVHSALQRHSLNLQDTADKLYFNHQELATFYTAPIYDVNGAYEVLATGSFALPSFIGDVAPPRAPPPRERAMLTSCANTAVLESLLAAQLPSGMAVLSVRLSLAALQPARLAAARAVTIPAPAFLALFP